MSSKKNRNRLTCRALTALAFLFAVQTAAPAPSSALKDFPIGDYGYAITLPSQWRLQVPEPGQAMDLYFLVDPGPNYYGQFTVHVLDRNGADMDLWLDYHVEKNLPEEYGACTVEAKGEFQTGPFTGRLFHLLDLPEREGRELLEALVFTDSHVVYLRYLYDRMIQEQAWKQMERIIASFTDSEEAVLRARMAYDKGRTLGFETVGLFLELPDGWVPEEINGRPWTIALPSGGSLGIRVFKKVYNGMDGLLDRIGRDFPGSSFDGRFDPLSSAPGLNAFTCTDPDRLAILGLNGGGGYALVLDGGSDAEEELLNRMMFNALLLDPKEGTSKCDKTLDVLRTALRDKDLAAVEEALSFLVLFSGSKNVAKAIGRGLSSTVEIQSACAIALGRMGSTEASRVLEKTLKNPLVCERTKRACIGALSTIGSEREEKVLKDMKEKPPRDFSPALCVALKETLMDLSRPRPPVR